MITLKTDPKELLDLLASYGRGWKNEIEAALAAHAYAMAVEEIRNSPKAPVASNTGDVWCDLLEQRAAAILAQLLQGTKP